MIFVRPSSTEPDLCVVVPAYNEAPNIGALYEEVCAALDGAGVTWTILFVDDGSTDDTPALLHALRQRDPRVMSIRLARNFGLQSALAAGMAYAPGRAVVIMDADLQDDPGAVRDFLARWRDGANVVYAVRTKRQEWFGKRALFYGFHAVLSRFADIPIPRDAGTFALYDRRVVNLINAMPDRGRYLPGLRAWVGLRQEGIPVARHARRAGRPAQSLARLMSLALDGLLSFSKAPLHLATTLGFSVTVLSAVALLVVAYWRFVQHSFPSGVGLATIALSLLFLGGVQLLLIGILGEYLGRVFDEVKQRPLFIVSDVSGIDALDVEPATGAPPSAHPLAGHDAGLGSRQPIR